MRRTWMLLVCAFGIAMAGCGKAKTTPPSANDVAEFQTAVQDGDAMVVDRLLKAKPALVNVPNQNGETPLKIANQKNNDELADVIKKHGGHE
jgi:ankyrin repeat protein